MKQPCGGYLKHNNVDACYVSLQFDHPAACFVDSGKLRLMYEAQALGYVVEQAGGSASDGIGSRELVETAEKFIREYDNEWVEAYMPYRNDMREPMSI